MTAVWIIAGALVVYMVYSYFIYKKRMGNFDPTKVGEHVTVLTDGTFDKKISDGVVLVDFWAAWCMPCRAVAPVIDELAIEMHPNAMVGKVDVDSNQQVARKLGIRSIPTLILFKNGKEVERFVGVKPKSTLKSAIEKHLKS